VTVIMMAVYRCIASAAEHIFHRDMLLMNLTSGSLLARMLAIHARCVQS